MNELAQNLVGEEGFRSELTITLTDRTALKIYGTLVGAGLTITLIAVIVPRLFPSRK